MIYNIIKPMKGGEKRKQEMIREHKIKQGNRLIGKGNLTFAYIFYYDNRKRITVRSKEKLNLFRKKYVRLHITIIISVSAIIISFISLMR